MRTLVAAGAGPLEEAVVHELLRRGHEPVVMATAGRPAGAAPREGVATARVDPQGPSSLRTAVEDARPDRVLALMPGPAWRPAGPPESPLARREKALRSLLTTAADAGAARFVHRSSVLAYGLGSPDGVELNEDRPIDAGPRGVRSLARSLRPSESEVAAAGGTSLRLGALHGVSPPSAGRWPAHCAGA
jgi:nucleoside-diphosphate-sugar epimerase